MVFFVGRGMFILFLYYFVLTESLFIFKLNLIGMLKILGLKRKENDCVYILWSFFEIF